MLIVLLITESVKQVLWEAQINCGIMLIRLSLLKRNIHVSELISFDNFFFFFDQLSFAQFFGKLFNYIPNPQAYFPGKIAATVFSLKNEFMEKTQGLVSCQSPKNTAGVFKFDM